MRTNLIFINNLKFFKLYLYAGTGYPCAGHSMSKFWNKLDLNDSAIIGNLGADELTGSNDLLRDKFFF